jgi:hypothetical protein
MPIILATQEAEIRRITVGSQPAQTVQKTLPGKKTSQKRAGIVAQGTDPEFKPQYHKKKKVAPVVPPMIIIGAQEFVTSPGNI